MLKLSGKPRSDKELGKKTKKLRQSGLIPAVLYGPKTENLNLSIKEKEFNKIYKEAGESTLVSLEVDGDKEKERIVLIYDLKRDTLNDKITHIDFYQVKMDQPIKVNVPLVFVGQSEAIERDKGILVKNLQNIEIEALPKELIHEIEVDISALKTFDDFVRVKDLKVPAAVKLTAHPNDIVVTVVPPRTKEEEGLEEAKPAQEAEKVETKAGESTGGEKSEASSN